jgi:hypothetical protein
LDTWHTDVLPYRKRGVQSHGTCGGAGDLPIKKVESGVTEHMTVLEPTLTERQSLMLQDTWRRVGAHPAHYLEAYM